MNNRITNELQSFMKDYAADPTPRDFAIAQHFYDLALEDVKKWVGNRADQLLDSFLVCEYPDEAQEYLEKRQAMLEVKGFIETSKQ